jgi:glutamyl-Q tRNA(Asp) synthetase
MTHSLNPDRSPLSTQAVVRFAPSPNGPLHRGHALSALFNAALAEKLGGRMLLRIEDIDPARSRPEHIAMIEETLAWLGIAYERPVRRQSQHMDDYAKAFATLNAQGLVYPCFCTRGEINAEVQARGPTWPRDPDGTLLYPGPCRHRTNDRGAKGEAPQWRLDMAKAVALTGPLYWRSFDPETGEVTHRSADPARWGDVVLRRKDTPTSYHLSVVVDDDLQGVTHIVRGVDLEAATDIHCVLQSLLGLPPPLYWHHALINGPDGKKLAKSRGSESLASERATGLTPSALYEALQMSGVTNGLMNPENHQPQAR